MEARFEHCCRRDCVDEWPREFRAVWHLLLSCFACLSRDADAPDAARRAPQLGRPCSDLDWLRMTKNCVLTLSGRDVTDDPGLAVL